MRKLLKLQKYINKHILSFVYKYNKIIHE